MITRLASTLEDSPQQFRRRHLADVKLKQMEQLNSFTIIKISPQLELELELDLLLEMVHIQRRSTKRKRIRRKRKQTSCPHILYMRLESFSVRLYCFFIYVLFGLWQKLMLTTKNTAADSLC